MTCATCKFLKDFPSGRMVSARCMATGITFPTVGVRCKDLCTDGDRAEISPDTFSCACHQPWVTPPTPEPRTGVRVENGRIV